MDYKMEYTVLHNDGLTDKIPREEIKSEWQKFKTEQDSLFESDPNASFLKCKCGVRIRITSDGHIETYHKRTEIKMHKEDCPHGPNNMRASQPSIEMKDGKYNISLRVKKPVKLRAQSEVQSHSNKRPINSSRTKQTFGSISRLGEIITALYIQDKQENGHSIPNKHIAENLYYYAIDNITINDQKVGSTVCIKFKEVLRINKKDDIIYIETHLGKEKHKEDTIHDSIVRFGNSHSGLSLASALANNKCRVIMIEYIDHTTSKTYPPEFFLVNKYGLFCDSTFEAHLYNEIFEYLSNKLNCNLYFTKPVKSIDEYDNANYYSDGNFYTFDKKTHEKKIEAIVEVFGRNDSDYLTRADKKASTCKYPLFTWHPNKKQQLYEAMFQIKKFIDKY